MLFRYAFPVPRSGEVISVAHYVECEGGAPSKAELISLFERKREALQQQTESAAELDNVWREIKDLEAFLYALTHLKSPDMPKLPSNGITDTAVFCETELGVNSIRVKVILPDHLDRPAMRLAGGE